MMTVLVTGGAGFIGSHLTEALLSRGEAVSLIDDLSTGSVDNIRHVRSHPRLECVFDTVMNRGVLAQLIDDADMIFHLAAAVGVRRIIDDPLGTIETNIKATEQVLEIASKKRKPVFIASTSEVYGKSDDLPFREDADLLLGPTTKARWSYACSKAVDEFLALAYWRQKKLPVVIGRLFNTVGPRQTGRYGMVLPNFINQALDGRPITVFGDGQQTRCFGYVAEVVEAMIRLMTSGRAYGEVVNIGNDQETTIEGLAQMVKVRIPSQSPIQLIPYEQAYEPGFEDMLRRTPCVKKLARLAGFRPSVPVREIVDSVASFFEQKRRATTAMSPRKLDQPVAAVSTPNG